MLESIWFRVLLMVFGIAIICHSQRKAWQKDLNQQKTGNKEAFKKAVFEFKVSKEQSGEIRFEFTQKENIYLYHFFEKVENLFNGKYEIKLFLEFKQDVSSYTTLSTIIASNGKQNPSFKKEFQSHYGILFNITVPDIEGGIYKITIEEDKSDDNT